MACSRSGCNEGLGLRSLLEGKAQLCPACWAELLVAKRAWPYEMTLSDVKEAIERFVFETKPGAERLT